MGAGIHTRHRVREIRNSSPNSVNLGIRRRKKNMPRRFAKGEEKPFSTLFFPAFPPFFPCGRAPHVKSCDFCAILVCNFLLFSYFCSLAGMGVWLFWWQAICEMGEFSFSWWGGDEIMRFFFSTVLLLCRWVVEDSTTHMGWTVCAYEAGEKISRMISQDRN